MPTEFSIHVAIAQFLRSALDHDAAVWAHYPAGEIRDKRTASKLKVMGTVAGWPDLMLLRNGQMYFLEIKNEKGRLSATQKAMAERLTQQGGFFQVARSVEDVEAILIAWGFPLRGRLVRAA